MEVDAVADELYGLSLDDFIAARAAREREAKGVGNKELAEAIHRLPKPNAVGWLVNQLVRQHPGDIQNLLELGSEMRDATANLSGDLRELSRRQHRVIRGLVQQAERLAKSAGRPVSAAAARSLEETFYAALADTDAADAVAAGWLAVGLRPSGFAGLAGGGGQGRVSTIKAPPRAEKRARAGTRRAGESRQAEKAKVAEEKRATAKVAEAKSVAGKATQAREEEHARLQQAEQRVADAGERVEQLRREVRDAVDVQSRATKDRRVALAAFDRADRAAERAQQRLNDAVAELEHVDR